MKTGICILTGLCVTLVCGRAAESTPVRIEQTVETQFPAALASTPITSGEARVVINVDAGGRLVDLLVSGYTHEAFASEAIRLLKAWRYSPASVDGRPVGARMELRLSFVSGFRVETLTIMESANDRLGTFKRQPIQTRVCTPRELDRPVVVLQTVNPADPGLAAAQRPAGATVVDFYVDEEGYTRMPVVVSSTQSGDARAALWALIQWRFATPTRGGKPVAVHVRQEFVFPANSTAAAASDRT